jgi:hypothetical protein
MEAERKPLMKKKTTILSEDTEDSSSESKEVAVVAKLVKSVIVFGEDRRSVKGKETTAQRIEEMPSTSIRLSTPRVLHLLSLILSLLL